MITCPKCAAAATAHVLTRPAAERIAEQLAEDHYQVARRAIRAAFVPEAELRAEAERRAVASILARGPTTYARCVRCKYEFFTDPKGD